MAILEDREHYKSIIKDVDIKGVKCCKCNSIGRYGQLDPSSPPGKGFIWRTYFPITTIGALANT